ncbi:MAG: response regulator [Anaerolineaceae bacterium]|nr:response regulator [Anaerolineaceae bacterium]
MENAHICVVEDSEITLFKLKAILVRLGYTVTTHSTPPDALAWLDKNSSTVNLIISDVNMPEMNGYEFVRKLRGNPATAQIPVMLLTSATAVNDKIAGLQAGADEYLSKTVSPTELELRIKALLSRKSSTEGTFTQSAARTISVFSLRGGVGKTSLAVNLAIALSRVWGGEAVLWDMALLTGHCALMLNLKGGNTIASLSNWEGETIDDEVVAGMLLNHESGIKLMPAPDKPAEAELITTRTIDLVWPYLQGSSAYIVVDAGNHFNDPVLTILERSDTILLMLSPEFASVKSALDVIKIFEKMGFESDKVIPIINDIFPTQRMDLNKIAQVFGNRPLLEIPYDSSSIIQSINSGQPFMVTSPKSDISRAILSLASKFNSKEKVPNSKK